MKDENITTFIASKYTITNRIARSSVSKCFQVILKYIICCDSGKDRCVGEYRNRRLNNNTETTTTTTEELRKIFKDMKLRTAKETCGVKIVGGHKKSNKLVECKHKRKSKSKEVRMERIFAKMNKRELRKLKNSKKKGQRHGGEYKKAKLKRIWRENGNQKLFFRGLKSLRREKLGNTKQIGKETD